MGTTGKISSVDVTSKPDGKAFLMVGLSVSVKAKLVISVSISVSSFLAVDGCFSCDAVCAVHIAAKLCTIADCFVNIGGGASNCWACSLLELRTDSSFDVSSSNALKLLRCFGMSGSFGR